MPLVTAEAKMAPGTCGIGRIPGLDVVFSIRHSRRSGSPTLRRADRRGGAASTWPGDPARAAKIITDIARLDEPSLRLLLAAGAVESARQASRARAREAENWPTSAGAPTSRLACYPGRPAAVASLVLVGSVNPLRAIHP